MWENELYIKREKCEFAQSKVHFFGHVINHGELRINEAKVLVIQEWEAPTKVTGLRSFLGLVNYYRRFISGYSAKATSLTELLKKTKPWVWTKHCHKAFEGLKTNCDRGVSLGVVRLYQDIQGTYICCRFCYWGVLMQDKHPIAFESRKLNETERGYTMQEREQVVKCRT